MLTIVLVLVVVYVSGKYAGFRFSIDLSNVYDLRSEARSFVMPLWLLYLWSATSNALPVLLVFFLLKKKWIWVLLIAFVIILNFSINGSKSTLFKMFLCFGLLFIKGTNILKYLVYGILVLGLVSILENFIFDTSFISSVVVRRVLYVPNLLDCFYFDYINQNHPIYYNPTFSSEIAFRIGEKYFANDQMRCNNGLFTDAYMNLGLLGCFIYPAIFTAFLKICESAFKNVNDKVVLYTTLMIVITLGSTTITTSLLTHGLFLLCFVLYCMPSLQK